MLVKTVTIGSGCSKVSTAVALTTGDGVKGGVTSVGLTCAGPAAEEGDMGVGVEIGVEIMSALTSGAKVGVKVGCLAATGVSTAAAISAAGRPILERKLKSVVISKKIIVPIITFKISKYASSVTHCQVLNLSLFTRLTTIHLRKHKMADQTCPVAPGRRFSALCGKLLRKNSDIKSYQPDCYSLYIIHL